MRRAVAMLVSVAFMLATPFPAGAREVVPTLHVESARIVARGAAVEVSYRVMCPAADYLTYLSTSVTPGTRGARTSRDTLELICTGKAQELTNLVTSSSVPLRPGTAAVSSELLNCTEQVPDCYQVKGSSSMRLKTHRARPETTQDVNARLRLISARPATRGRAALAYALTCPQGGGAFLSARVTQANGAGVTEGGALSEFECTGRTEMHALVVSPPSGAAFSRRPAVITAEVSDCNEPSGCFQGLDTSIVKRHRHPIPHRHRHRHHKARHHHGHRHPKARHHRGRGRHSHSRHS